MKIDNDKLTTAINQYSRKIAQEIILDMIVRNGFGDNWEDLDGEVKAEVRAQWRSIARKALAEFGLVLMKEVLGPVREKIEKELEAKPGGGET